MRERMKEGLKWEKLWENMEGKSKINVEHMNTVKENWGNSDYEVVL